MFQKVIVFTLLLLFIPLSAIHAQGHNQIELFDIEKGIVIKTEPSNSAIQDEVEKYLSSINGIVVKISPIPSKGLMIKIPLEPPFHVQNEWMDSIVEEIIVIFSEKENPYLMTFDDENNPYFFTFTNGDTEQLLKLFNLNKNKLINQSIIKLFYN